MFKYSIEPKERATGQKLHLELSIKCPFHFRDCTKTRKSGGIVMKVMKNFGNRWIHQNLFQILAHN